MTDALARHIRHCEYLDLASSGENPAITPETSSHAFTAWDEIWSASCGLMPVPAACTGPSGEMFYSWDRGRHHLELEIIPGKPAFFFYRDRETGQLWSEDYNIGGRLPAEAIEKFRLFM